MSLITNIFARATRLKLRFPISGLISLEDVWDLPLKSKREGGPDLNTLAQTLDDLVSKEPRRSFVDDETVDAGDPTHNRLKLELVLAIIECKKAERADKQNEAVRAGQARELDELIAKKQGEALSNLPLEELIAKRAALG